MVVKKNPAYIRETPDLPADADHAKMRTVSTLKNTLKGTTHRQTHGHRNY